MSRSHPVPLTPDTYRILVGATLSDHMARLRALEAKEAARRARQQYIAGRLTEEALADRLAKLAKARRAAADAAFWRRHCELKFNPNQPRDDHGRWTSGGGGSKLSTYQKGVAASLQGVISETGEITPATYEAMRNAGLQIGDILGPGIYQAEFTPEGQSGKPNGPYVPVPVAKHSQFVFIDERGASHLLSAGPGGPHQGNLTIITGSFDGSGPHSLGTIVGDRAETISMYNVGVPDGEKVSRIWKNMNFSTNEISNINYIYDILNQNSNSVFYFIAKKYRLSVDNSHFMPGSGRYLLR